MPDAGLTPPRAAALRPARERPLADRARPRRRRAGRRRRARRAARARPEYVVVLVSPGFDGVPWLERVHQAEALWDAAEMGDARRGALLHAGRAGAQARGAAARARRGRAADRVPARDNPPERRSYRWRAAFAAPRGCRYDVHDADPLRDPAAHADRCAPRRSGAPGPRAGVRGDRGALPQAAARHVAGSCPRRGPRTRSSRPS